MTDPITTPAQMREAAIYYMDCEFDGHSGPLLSLALVRDDGYSTHIRVNIDANDPWVQANVMPIMDNHGADIAVTVDPGCVGQAIRDFIGPSEHPLIIADSPVDIGRFCAAISTASDGQWSSVDYPKISFAVHNVACYPTKLAGAVQHNAWWDAMALRDTLRALPVAERQAIRDEPMAVNAAMCAEDRAKQFNEAVALTLFRQAIRDQALDDAAQAASNRAAYFRDAAETASEAGFHALRAFHAMRELCLVEIAAAIRAMKGKPE
jgi:hypothetical protein